VSLLEAIPTCFTTMFNWWCP